MTGRKFVRSLSASLLFTLLLFLPALAQSGPAPAFDYVYTVPVQVVIETDDIPGDAQGVTFDMLLEVHSSAALAGAQVIDHRLTVVARAGDRLALQVGSPVRESGAPAPVDASPDSFVDYAYAVPVQVTIATDAIPSDVDLQAYPLRFTMHTAGGTDHPLTVTAQAGDRVELAVGAPVYVGSASATSHGEPVTVQPAAAPAQTGGDRSGTATRNANLRGGPGTNYPVVGNVRAGQTLTIGDTNPAGDWYRLASGAWIAAFLVDGVSVVSAGLPVVEQAAGAVAPVVGSPRVLMPTTGSELTLGDGTRIRHPMPDNVPVPADNEWVRVKDGTPLYAGSGDASDFRLNTTIAFAVKQGTPVEITVEDVTYAPFGTLIHDASPNLVDGNWAGTGSSVAVGHDTTPWVFEPGDTILIYRITMRMADGQQIVFYQPANIEDASKAFIRKILGE